MSQIRYRNRYILGEFNFSIIRDVSREEIYILKRSNSISNDFLFIMHRERGMEFSKRVASYYIIIDKPYIYMLINAINKAKNLLNINK